MATTAATKHFGTRDNNGNWVQAAIQEMDEQVTRGIRYRRFRITFPGEVRGGLVRVEMNNDGLAYNATCNCQHDGICHHEKALDYAPMDIEWDDQSDDDRSW